MGDRTVDEESLGALRCCAPVRGPYFALADRGQSGSILLLVLAVVLMLTIGVLAVLNMTITAGRTATSLELSTKAAQRVDGALEKSVNAVRDDEAACPTQTGTTENYGDYDVECRLAPPPATPVIQSRTMDFFAYPAGSTSNLVGKARVRVVDEANGVENVGYSIEVCDWLLGGTAATQAVKGCSS